MTRLVAIAGVVGISFSAIFVALADVSPSTSAFLRMLLALPVLAVLAWRQRALAGMERGAARFALLAGLVFALNITIWHHNIDLIGTGLSTVMGNAQVVFIGFVAWALYGERPTALALGAVPIMLFAVVLISGLVGEGARIERPWLGAGLGVATAVLNATWFLLFREARRRARGSAGVLTFLTGAAAVGALAFAPTDPGFTLAVPLQAYGWILALALSAQVVGWLFITPALAQLPALEVAILMLLQPVLTLVWGALVFREAHSVWQWLGVGLLLPGGGVVNLYGSPRVAAAPVARGDAATPVGQD